jgi:hypothetical protein
MHRFRRSHVAVFDELQMQLEERLVMRPDPSAKHFDQSDSFSLCLTLGKVSQLFRVALPDDNRVQDGPTALSQDVRQHAADLQIGVAQPLLDTLIVLRRFTYQLLRLRV